MLLGHLPPSPAALLASPSGPDSPLGTYLRDPGGTLRAVLTDVAQWGTIWGPVAGPALAFAAAGLGWARWWWRRRCRRMLNADARIVIVLPPPTADPAGAEALWANLLGLLRPAWRRRLTGQPHLAWEYSFDRETIRIRLWVPGVVPPGMVERAIEAAWPGARTRTAPAAPPTLSAGPHAETAGGELRLARPEALPIRTTFPADPIRALLGAPVGLGSRRTGGSPGSGPARHRAADRQGPPGSAAGTRRTLCPPHQSPARRAHPGLPSSAVPPHRPGTGPPNGFGGIRRGQGDRRKAARRPL